MKDFQTQIDELRAELNTLKSSNSLDRDVETAIRERLGLDFKITGVGTSSPNSSVVVSNYWTSDTGGEVEVIQGVGAGICSHITNAVNNAGTWTVTVDETHTGATGTAKARFNNWTKIGSVTDQTSDFDN